MHRAGDGQGRKRRRSRRRRSRRRRLNFNGKTAFAMENTFMFVSLCSYVKTLQKMRGGEESGERGEEQRMSLKPPPLASMLFSFICLTHLAQQRLDYSFSMRCKT